MTSSAVSLVPVDQRFAQLIQQFGLTKNSFAMSLGKTASVVQHLIDGRNKPGFDLLCKVFEIYPNVSRDWLLLGRGPMLVSGEHVPKPVAAPKIVTAEAPFEPIDLTDVERPASRRASPGVAGSQLQPAEIVATLALAAAANQPARTAAPAPAATSAPEEVPAAPAEPIAPVVAAPPISQAAPEPAPTAPPIAPSAPAAASTPAAALDAPAAFVPPVPVVPNPEVYVSAALHAQHLQHQLVLAEMRNQHLLEQQQMLREMLAMARQAMV